MMERLGQQTSLAQQFGQLTLRDRFLDKLFDAILLSDLLLLAVDVGCDAADKDIVWIDAFVRKQFLDLLDRLDAVKGWHCEVGQNELKVRLIVLKSALHSSDCLEADSANLYLEAKLTEHLLDGKYVERTIIDDEYFS